jgi:pimeloyl-ACP methyl ester carboxylesterase
MVAVFAIVCVILYVLLALIVVHLSEYILLPLRGSHAQQVWLWPSGGTKLLLYLQGNAEKPGKDGQTVAFFLDQGWDVLAVGYNSTLKATEHYILRAFNETAPDYAVTAIFARSLGTCFAPAVCQKAPRADTIQFVVYATPVTSVARLFNWHTCQAFKPVSSLFAGADRGLSQHVSTHKCFVILAQDDTITPHAEAAAFLKQGVPAQGTVFKLDGVGHNNFESADDYVDILHQITASKN